MIKNGPMTPSFTTAMTKTLSYQWADSLASVSTRILCLRYYTEDYAVMLP